MNALLIRYAAGITTERGENNKNEFIINRINKLKKARTKLLCNKDHFNRCSRRWWHSQFIRNVRDHDGSAILSLTYCRAHRKPRTKVCICMIFSALFISHCAFVPNQWRVPERHFHRRIWILDRHVVNNEKYRLVDVHKYL